VRGKRYFVVERGENWIRVGETPDGPPIRLDAAPEGRGSLRLVHHLHRAYMELYAPVGSGPGKGAVDLTACRNTMMSGNRLSARGDTMHIHSCRTNVFSQNQITASRMGAFFLSEWCSDSTIVANTVHGTNGSRVMSVEKSNRDVTIIGNTFRGGGRGSWINQPENIIIQGNVFINNTTKGEADPHRGRRTFETGDYERRSELYFTTHEPDGRYGPAIVHDNIFQTGPEAVAAVELHAGGHDISIKGNHFGGSTSRIIVDDSCERVEISHNIDLIKK
jgi:nitrous oxidase accessory protein NosD